MNTCPLDSILTAVSHIGAEKPSFLFELKKSKNLEEKNLLLALDLCRQGKWGEAKWLMIKRRKDLEINNKGVIDLYSGLDKWIDLFDSSRHFSTTHIVQETCDSGNCPRIPERNMRHLSFTLVNP